MDEVLARAGSLSTVSPTVGQISQHSSATAAYFGIVGVGAIDVIEAPFTVDQSGMYRLHIYGFTNVDIREGSSASAGGVSKSGGKLWVEGGLTTIAFDEQLLYETDYDWDDDTSNGDEDGVMEAGELLELEVELRSNFAVTNVHATLTTSDSIFDDFRIK